MEENETMKKTKFGLLRILLCAILSLCLALPLAACGKGGNGGGNGGEGDGGGDVVTQSITLTPDSLNVKEEEDKTVQATLVGLEGTVAWESDKPGTATVTVDETDSTKATVTGVAEGTAKITASIGGKSAECAVTVTAKDSGGVVKSITITPSSLELEEEESKPVEATVVGIDGEVHWTSNNNAAIGITVDETDSTKATITGLAEGTAELTAEAGGEKATCNVTVTAKEVVGAQGTPINHAENQGAAQGNTNAWNYFLEDSAVTVNKCEIIGEDFAADNKILVDYSYSGSNWTAFNLLYMMTAGKPTGYEVTFNFKSSVAGKLTVVGPSDQTFDISVGDNVITKNFEGAMLWLRFGGAGIAPLVGSFEISGIQIKEIEKTQLSKPSFSYDSTSGIITIDSAPNADKQVKEYKLNFYQDNELKGSTVVVSGEVVVPVGVEPGTYTVKLVAVGDNVRYTDSPESDDTAQIIVSSLNNKRDMTKVNNDGEDLNNNKDQWAIWAMQDLVNVTEASYDSEKNEIVITYDWKSADPNAHAWYGIRIYYRQSAPPKSYIHCTINVESAGIYRINNQHYYLNEGDNDLYIAFVGTDFMMTFGQLDTNPGRDAQTVTISDIEFTDVAPSTPTAPVA